MLPTLAVALLLPAAPVPKDTEKEKIEKRFGKFEGEKGVKLRMDRDTLIMGMPKGDDIFFTETPARVVSEVKGPFRIEVAIRYPAPKMPRQGAEDIAESRGGGLGVWGADGDTFQVGIYHYQEFIAAGRRPPDSGHVSYTQSRFGGNSSSETLPMEVAAKAPAIEEPFWMRLTRSGGKITAEYRDGDEWVSWREEEDKFPPTVRVGVHAAVALETPVDIRFSDFMIAPLKEAKK